MAVYFATVVALFAIASSANPVPAPNPDSRITLAARQEESAATTAVAAPLNTDRAGPDYIPTSCEVQVTQPGITYTNYASGEMSGSPTTAIYSSQIKCICDGSIRVEGTSSRAPAGEVYYFCSANGPQWSTSAASTSIPSDTPGEPDNAAWAKIQCDDGSFTSSLNNPYESWNDSAADAAWSDAVDAFNIDDKGADFSAFIIDFFHTRPGMNCDRIDEPNCDVTIQCGTGMAPNAPVNSPAGYMIVNSIIGLHNMYDRLWRGINDAAQRVLFEIDKFAAELSPVNKAIMEQKEQRLALDGMQMGLTALMAPFFHVTLVRQAFVQRNPNVFGTGVDVSYGFLGASIGFIKDSMESLSTVPIQNEVKAHVGTVIDNWKYALGNGTQKMFNDPEALLKSIHGGLTFPQDLELDKTAMDAQASLRLFLLASVLPAVWSTGPGLPIVSIITSDDIPQDGTGCDSYKIEDYEQTITDSVTDGGLMVKGLMDITTDARICDNQGRAYWLVTSATKKTKEICSPSLNGPPIQRMCDYSEVLFEAPYGLDKLDGTNYAGLTKEGLAFNAINSWVRNDHKNGWKGISYDLANADDYDDLLSGDLGKVAGVVKINVCSLPELEDTVWNDPLAEKENPNYPCPA